MNAPHPSEPLAIADIPGEIVDQAISWTVKLDFNTPDAATRRDFDAWLLASPLHWAAWQRIRALNAEFRLPDPGLALNTLEAARHPRDRRTLARRQALKLVAALCAVGLGAWLAGHHAPWQRMLADASTGIGQRRTMHLPDGTVVVLNTDTAIDTDIDGHRRVVNLRRGEIMVTTSGAAHGPQTPLYVRTPVGRLQAMSTSMVVRLGDDSARVTVQDGAVTLFPASGRHEVIANRGESWRMEHGGTARMPHPGFNVASWTRGVIDVHRMRLADLLAELGRYRAGHIACDHRVADLPVTGIYQLDDTDSTLEFLAQRHPVRIVRRTPLWLSVEPATLDENARRD